MNTKKPFFIKMEKMDDGETKYDTESKIWTQSHLHWTNVARVLRPKKLTSGYRNLGWNLVGKGQEKLS